MEPPTPPRSKKLKAEETSSTIHYELKDIADNFTEIVLTGGPASGKSSALKVLPQVLGEQGIRTLCSPEVATLLLSGGIHDLDEIRRNHEERYFQIEKQLVYLQMSMRKHFQDLARSFAPDPICILYDRGELDTAAYLPSGHLRTIIGSTGQTEAEVRDSYDAVIHLHSSAILGPEYYSKNNNPYRIEDAKEAELSDQATLSAWLGHPHLWIVRSQKDVEDKLKRLSRIVMHVAGLESSIEIEKKFLLEKPDMTHPALQRARAVQIEQIYLPSASDAEIRIRHRKDLSGSSYHWAEKRSTDKKHTREERELMISKREYDLFLQGGAVGKIEKTRYYLIHDELTIEIDHFPKENLWLAEVELVDPSEEIILPKYLNVQKEVTGERKYSSNHIATS